MIEVLAPLGLVVALVAVLYAIASHAWRRHVSFDATIRRRHPELRTIAPHSGDLGAVAVRAVNVRTPVAPRTVGDWEAS